MVSMRFTSVLIAALALLSGQATAQAANGYIRPAGESVSDFLDCMRGQKASMVTAHRGGVVGGLAENSLEAMAHTAASIPTLLEVDIQRTKDGVLFLMHDDEIDRTTNGAGRIADLNWDQIRDLKLENHAGLATGSSPPTLDQTLEWARGRAIVQLDVKRGVPFEGVVAAIRKAKAQSYALIIVYNAVDAAKVTALDPTISVNVNLSNRAELDNLQAHRVSLDNVTAFTGIGTPNADFWAELHRRGVSVGYGVLWNGDLEIATSGDDARYAQLAQAGADVIVTDRHFEAYRAIEKIQDTRGALEACSVRP